MKAMSLNPLQSLGFRGDGTDILMVVEGVKAPTENIKDSLRKLLSELVYFLTIKKDKHYVDKARSNRNEVWV